MTHTIKIDSLSYGPYGIGRKEGKAVLVPLTAPGDLIEARIREEKKNHSIGELSSLIEPSPLREIPPCPYFGACGGCPWQHIKYEGQLAAKERCVMDALRRIGKLDGFELLSIIPSPQQYHYRGRIRLHADERKRLGFNRLFTRELIEIDSCLIGDRGVDELLKQAKQLVRELDTQIQHLEIVRGDDEAATFSGTAAGAFSPEDDVTCNRFLEGRKRISGIVLFGRRWRKSWGKGKIVLSLEEGLRLEVDADAFTQVNRGGNKNLIRELLHWGEFSDQDRVLELYSGAGNFTLPVARRSGEIVAIEGNPTAIANGESNSSLNKIHNIRWIRSHVPSAIRDLREKGDRFTKIILNPPRSGAKGLEDDLACLGAEKILYVSCDPATLARDLSALVKKGYRLKRVRPVDLFPQTFHVETLAEAVL